MAKLNEKEIRVYFASQGLKLPEIIPKKHLKKLQNEYSEILARNKKQYAEKLRKEGYIS